MSTIASHKILQLFPFPKAGFTDSCNSFAEAGQMMPSVKDLFATAAVEFVVSRITPEHKKINENFKLVFAETAEKPIFRQRLLTLFAVADSLKRCEVCFANFTQALDPASKGCRANLPLKLA